MRLSVRLLWLSFQKGGRESSHKQDLVVSAVASRLPLGSCLLLQIDPFRGKFVEEPLDSELLPFHEFGRDVADQHLVQFAIELLCAQ